MLGKKKEPN